MEKTTNNSFKSTMRTFYYVQMSILYKKKFVKDYTTI